MAERALMNRRVISWALYDWGSSGFALSVLAVLFPVFLGSYWSDGAEGAVVTQRLSLTNLAAAVIVLVLAPILGTIADSGGHRKRFLLLFGAVGAIGTASLSMVSEGSWPVALAFFMMASVGYYCANIFYDALIVDVSEAKNYSLVSSFGFALGYIGGAVLLAVHVFILRDPPAFGFAGATEAVRFAFATVGIWWLIFLLPAYFVVREQGPGDKFEGSVVTEAFRRLRETITQVRKYRDVVRFLIAYWLYIGGVFTVIVMAANFGQRLGFDQSDLITAFLVTNFVGFPATLAFGYIGHRFGARNAVYLGLAVYVGVVIWGHYLNDIRDFFMMAIAVGMVQGGVQGMSRSYYADLIPAESSGEFFGFYNMVTKFAHVLGPACVAIAATLSSDPRYVLYPIMPLFLLGMILLTRVSKKA